MIRRTTTTLLFIISTILLTACDTKTKTKTTDKVSDAIATTDSIAVQVTIEEIKEEQVSFTQPLKIDTEMPTGVHFAVDNVAKAKGYLTENKTVKVYGIKTGKELLYSPSKYNDIQIVAHGGSLVSTIHECYDQHRPLVLSPDAVWLTIAQGAALHIRINMNTLESQIFKADKPEKIRARNDSLAEGSDHWMKFIGDLSKETKQYTQQNIYSLFVPQFSTTGSIETTAYQIALLEAYKDIFMYVGETGCGIPYVTLRGTQEDWLAMYSKLDQLETIGMKDWANELKPIIQEFIKVYDNDINTVFWQDIYKNYTAYMENYISGWILKFYPYVICEADSKVDYTEYDEQMGGVKVPLSYKKNPYLKKSDYLLSMLGILDLPSGMSRIDLEWNNHFTNTTTNVEIYAGFWGSRQYKDKSLEPFISWAVVNADKKIANHEYLVTRSTVEEDGMIAYQAASLKKAWLPHLAEESYSLARYNPDTNKTQKESLVELVQYIEQKLEGKYTDQLKAENKIDVQLIVLSNGDITYIEINNSDNAAIISDVKDILNQLPHSWQAGNRLLSHTGDYILPEEGMEAANNTRANVNSRVSFKLFEQK